MDRKKISKTPPHPLSTLHYLLVSSLCELCELVICIVVEPKKRYISIKRE